MAPVVPFGLLPEQHFSQAPPVRRQGCPLDFPAPADLDLRFAAQEAVKHFGSLERLRHRALAAVEGLGRRLEPVSCYIRSQQPDTVCQVNPDNRMALIALLVVVFSWPDSGLLSGFLQGFPAVGHAAPCGVWDVKPAAYEGSSGCLRLRSG